MIKLKLFIFTGTTAETTSDDLVCIEKAIKWFTVPRIGEYFAIDISGDGYLFEVTGVHHDLKEKIVYINLFAKTASDLQDLMDNKSGWKKA